MVIIFREHEQFVLSRKAWLHILDHISEWIIDCDIEVTKTKKICIFCDSNLAIVDALHQLKDLLLLLVAVYLAYHLISDETVHLAGTQVVI